MVDFFFCRVTNYGIVKSTFRQQERLIDMKSAPPFVSYYTPCLSRDAKVFFLIFNLLFTYLILLDNILTQNDKMIDFVISSTTILTTPKKLIVILTY